MAERKEFSRATRLLTMRFIYPWVHVAGGTMDQSESPGDDFYQYVNGDWIAAHPVPPDKTAYDAFTELNDTTETQLRTLVEEAADNTEAAAGTPERMIGDLYRTGMDTGAIEGLGLAPLKEYLEHIDHLQSAAEVQPLIAWLMARGIDSCFGLSAEIDARNSTMMIAGLEQGGLGLPNREYYLKSDAASAETRVEYQGHIANMMAFLEKSAVSARSDAETVMQMETRLANASKSPEENRDPEATYHKVNRDELGTLCPGIDWDAFFDAIGYPEIHEINVHQPEFFAELGRMMTDSGVEEWKVFLSWKLINGLAPFLDSRFEQENFAFYGKVLNGQPEMKPRWKRVLAALDAVLGDAVGKMYVERYFPPEAKERTVALVENLRAAFRSRIENLSWMGPETKKEALEKLTRVRLKIGYPDRWEEYRGLEVGSDSYAGNMFRAMGWDFRNGPLGLDKAGKPVDPMTWYMHPQTINAYYDPGMNEIVFPAAILQAPFFSMEATDAANFGAIGAVIGHEMTHGFDDTGRKYDSSGNLRDWWTKEDEEKFSLEAQVLVDRYSSVEVLPGLYANGRLTLGENISDFGGLTIAYHAYADLVHKEEHGASEFRRLFISYATIWRENIRPEALRNQVLSDVHAPTRLRVNCVVFDMPEFYEVFPEITPAGRLYLPPEKRPVIW
jgi:putative endopeptidase